MDTFTVYGDCGSGYIRVIIPQPEPTTTSTCGNNRCGGTGDMIDTGTIPKHQLKSLLCVAEYDARLLIEATLEAEALNLNVFGYAKFEEMIELIPIDFRPQSPYVRKAEINSPDGRHATPDRGSGLWYRGGSINF